MAAVFIGSIYGKGYTTVGQRNKVLIYCGIVSFVLLLIIYGSLLYMGACVSGDYAQNIGRAELLVAIINEIVIEFLITLDYTLAS